MLSGASGQILDTVVELSAIGTHVDTNCGDLGGTMLVELVSTGLAAEAMEQKLKAEVTKGQAEECLPYKIVHGQGDIFEDLHNELLAVQGGNGRVPGGDCLSPLDEPVDHAAILIETSHLEGLVQRVVDTHAIPDSHHRALLVGQVHFDGAHCPGRLGPVGRGAPWWLHGA